MNPIYGSVGLLWSGNWQLCQNAVEAVLRGAPISQIECEAAETNNGPPLKAYDIRHVSKNEKSDDLHRVRTRCRFKRSAANKPKVVAKGWVGSGDDESAHEEGNRSTSHESSLSHQSAAAAAAAARNGEGESQDTESLASEGTAEVEVLERVEPESSSEKDERAGDGEIELELTLGLEWPHSRTHGVKPKESIKRSHEHADVSEDGVCRMELGLDYSA